MSDETHCAGYSESWIEVVAAVDYLSSTHRPGLSVWTALAEALRLWIDSAVSQVHKAQGRSELLWHDADPLRSALDLLLQVVSPAGAIDGQDLSAAMDGALCCWLDTMAAEFNDGLAFVIGGGPPDSER